MEARFPKLTEDHLSSLFEENSPGKVAKQNCACEGSAFVIGTKQSYKRTSNLFNVDENLVANIVRRQQYDYKNQLMIFYN
jgi:hypothetical protein